MWLFLHKLANSLVYKTIKLRKSPRNFTGNNSLTYIIILKNIVAKRTNKQKKEEFQC